MQQESAPFFTVSFLDYPEFLYAHSFVSPNYRFSSRRYRFLEIVYVTKGGFSINLDGTDFYAKKGDCMVILPGTMATLVSDTKYDRHAHLSVGVQCSLESVPGKKPDLRRHIFSFPVQTKPQITHPEEFAALFEKLIKAHNENKKNLVSGLFLQLCSIISANEGTAVHASKSAYTRKIRDYIENNYQNQITIPLLANYLSITPEYASNVFKRETGETIISYLNRKRIGIAKELLQRRGISIQAVAEQVGIVNVAYFSRLFKKTEGISPSEYRSSLQREYIGY